MLKLFKIYASAYHGLPRQAWLLFLVILVNRSGMMVVFFMSLYLTRHLHFSTTQAGQLIGIFGVGSLVGAYGGGWLTDKIGSFRVQLYSLLSTAVAMIILGYMHSFGSIAAMLVVVAILNDALRPASITAFAEICPPELQARAFAFNRLAVNLGTAIGPAVGGYLVTIHYGLIFWVDALTCLASGILFFFLFRRVPPGHGRPKEEKPASGPLSPWKDRFFLLLMAGFLSLGIIFFQLFNTWPLYLRDFLNIPEPRIGLLLTLNALMIVVIEMPMVHRLEARPPLQVAVFGSVFVWSGFALLNAGSSYGFVALTVMIWTMGEMLVFPMTAATIAGRARDYNRGVYMGIYTLTFSMSFVIGPVVGSWVYDTWGPRTLWYAAGIAGALITLALGRLYYISKAEQAKQAV